MSVTPGNIKLSPFGNAINKNLLTPCRRVGLSRKKSTPNSITKLLSEDLNNSNSSTSEVTPVSSNVGKKRKSRSTLDSPADKNILTTTKNVESKVKKSLGQCFGKDENSSDKNSVQCDVKVSPKKETRCLEVRLVELNSKQNLNSDSKKDNSSDSDLKPNKLSSLRDQRQNVNDVTAVASDIVMKNQVLSIPTTNEGIVTTISSHTQKNNTLYNSDDEFKITANDTKIKTYERKKNLDRSNSLSTKITDTFEHCSIKHKHSEEEITIVESKNAAECVNISSDEENICVVKKKKKSLLSDDDESYSPDVSKKSKTKKDVEKVSKNKDSSKTRKNKVQKIASLKSSSTFEEDDDDAFTSTPDREKNEKQELISKIKALEKAVKDKKAKLDNLKRASLYKSKHNIEELKSVTKIWKQGCNMGLEGLLKQLQNHGPMDMPTLLRNLQIPQEVSSKVFNNLI